VSLSDRSTDVDVRLQSRPIGEGEWHDVGLSVEAEPGIHSAAQRLSADGLEYRLVAYRASVLAGEHRLNYEVGVEGDLMRPHPPNAACLSHGCVAAPYPLPEPDDCGSYGRIAW